MPNRLGTYDCFSPLGAVETRPSELPFWKFIKPTDFDFAYENMRLRIKQTTTLTEGFKYLGFFGDTLKKWLLDYIRVSAENKKSYDGDLGWWTGTFKNEFGNKYSGEELIKYFKTFDELKVEKQIPENIYMPYEYIPEKTNVLSAVRDATKELTGISYGKVLLTGAVLVGVYGLTTSSGKKLIGKVLK